MAATPPPPPGRGSHRPLAVASRRAPVVAETLLTHSNVRVRNVATVGGNLAHGDPHMDLPPVLIALGASVRVVGPSGERDIPVEELINGYMTTVLGNDELIAALRLSAPGFEEVRFARDSLLEQSGFEPVVPPYV